MPVPAGIRCPMMMFSFNPSRSSLAPRIAASVSTRVVSWKEAAEMNDCVVKLAFVMPSSSGARALDPQNVVRIHRTLGETVTRPHPVAFVHAQVFARGHLVQLRLAFLRMHPDLALAALDLAEPHHAVHFGNRGGVLRPARLEQLGDA